MINFDTLLANSAGDADVFFLFFSENRLTFHASPWETICM